eukprot:GHVO01004106.1.p1 GENE.GHVO01004106.1~~GHVO01004106.1.p1  ORF type:complete len:238 (+),score=64.25 GHVO01004106.1:23-715(+)
MGGFDAEQILKSTTVDDDFICAAISPSITGIRKGIIRAISDKALRHLITPALQGAHDSPQLLGALFVEEGQTLSATQIPTYEKLKTVFGCDFARQDLKFGTTPRKVAAIKGCLGSLKEDAVATILRDITKDSAFKGKFEKLPKLIEAWQKLNETSRDTDEFRMSLSGLGGGEPTPFLEDFPHLAKPSGNRLSTALKRLSGLRESLAVEGGGGGGGGGAGFKKRERKLQRG